MEISALPKHIQVLKIFQVKGKKIFKKMRKNGAEEPSYIVETAKRFSRAERAAEPKWGKSFPAAGRLPAQKGHVDGKNQIGPKGGDSNGQARAAAVQKIPFRIRFIRTRTGNYIK